MSILNCAHLHILFCVKQKEHIFGRAAVKINETNYSKILLLYPGEQYKKVCFHCYRSQDNINQKLLNIHVIYSRYMIR